MTEHGAVPESASFDRRSFMRKLAVGGFAIPVIASFRLDSLAHAGNNMTPPGHAYGNMTCPEQSFPNQLYGNQAHGGLVMLGPFPMGCSPIHFP